MAIPSTEFLDPSQNGVPDSIARGGSLDERRIPPAHDRSSGGWPILEPAGCASLLTRVKPHLIRRTGTSVRLSTLVVTDPMTMPPTVPRPRVPMTIWSMAFSVA